MCPKFLCDIWNALIVLGCRVGIVRSLNQIYRLVRTLVDPDFRRSRRNFTALDQKIQFQILARAKSDGELLAAIKVKPKSTSNRRALLVHSLSISALPIEAALCWGLHSAGYKVTVLSTRAGDNPAAYFRHLGIVDFISWENISLPGEFRFAGQLAKPILDVESLFGHEHGNIRTGRYAASTALKELKVGSLRLQKDRFREKVLPCLQESIWFAGLAPRLLDVVRPAIIVSQDVGYSPRGQLSSAGFLRNIDTITWNTGHKDNTIMLKRYSGGNADVHPASLSNTSWQKLKRMSWTEDHTLRVIQELSSSYESGSWYSEVGTHFKSRLYTREKLQEKLDLDPEKKTAAIFSHMFWDATFFYGEDLFENYEDWFVQTVRAACSNTTVNWVIKIHPGNIVKNRRVGKGGDLALEVEALREQVGRLPPHVKVMMPDTEISTYSLYQAIDYALTVRGTIGIEAAALGIRVLTAGTGRFDRRGFTRDFISKRDYLNQLTEIIQLEPMTPAEKELAQRFAYGVFVMRPVSLSAIRLASHRDETASPDTGINASSAAEWNSSSDMNEIKSWLESSAEDYLNLRS